jgi:hypothetical protein
MRFSIATLLFITLLVSAYFPLKDLFEPWQRARIMSQHPLYALQLDNARLSEGDTVEAVSSVFPTMRLIQPDSDFDQTFRQNMVTMGAECPEDVDLYRHDSHGVIGILMFQNGRLVMRGNDDNPAAVAQRRLITPSLWFRAGIFPIYILIASVLLAAWVFGCRRIQSSDNKALHA